MIESFANLFLSRIYTVRLFRGINVSLCEIHLDSQWCNGRFLALSAVEPFDTKRSSTVFLPLPKTDQVQSARSPLDKTKDSEDVPALQLLAPARLMGHSSPAVATRYYNPRHRDTRCLRVRESGLRCTPAIPVLRASG